MIAKGKILLSCLVIGRLLTYVGQASNPAPTPGAQMTTSTPIAVTLLRDDMPTSSGIARNVRTEQVNGPEITEWSHIEPAIPLVLDGDRRCPCNPRTDLCGCQGAVIRECQCYRYSLEPGMQDGYPYKLDAARDTAAAVVAAIHAELAVA